MRATQLLAACALTACASAEGTGDAGNGSIDGSPPPIDGAAPDSEPGAPDAEVPDAMLFDADIDMQSFTDDTASDFSTGGGTLTETTVESWGAVAPVAYYQGGLLQRASDTELFTDGTTATWAQVQGFTSTGKASIMLHTDVNWGTDTPPSVGLTDGENWSMWFEGEIYLEAGAWTFYLWVDDHGFAEIAQPGSSTFLRLVSANWDVESSGTFTAAAAGWYPFRYAIAEQGVGAQTRLRFSGPGVGLQVIPRHRFRTRVDQLTGMVLTGFDDSHGAGDVDATIDSVGPGYTDWGGGNPGDLGMTAADLFSVRWTGQFRVDVAGNYAFNYVTDDGQRLWIDGTQAINEWDIDTSNNTTGAFSLAAGWHDVVIEQTENFGGAAAFLTVASGPELTGQALPVARLRPAEGRSDRVAVGGVNLTDVTLADVATVTSAVTVTAPSGVTATSVDVVFDFFHEFKGDMRFSLRAPNNQTIEFVDFTGSTTGTFHEAFTVTGWTAAPVAGTWTLLARDEFSSDVGTLYNVAITPHYSGGEAPIPITSSYESTVRDLGGAVTSVDMVSWTERLPTGSDITVQVRTGATPEACASASYSPALSSPGIPSVPAGRYLQYRVQLTSNGDRPPALDALTVSYRVAL